MHPKGLSSLVASIIYIGIIAGAVVGIATFAGPIFENMADSRTIQAMLDEMPRIEETFTAVAEAGRGSRQQLGIQFQQGELEIRKGSDTIEYLLQTRSDIVSPSGSRQFGNIRISAGANVYLNRTTISGTPCWMLRNTHVEACIKHIPRQERGLVAYWPLDQGRGQSIEDASNNSNTGVRGTSTGTDQSDPSWTTACRYGSCLRFDGSEDFVNVSHSESLAVQDTVSITAWFNVDEKGTDENRIVWKPDQWNFQQYNDGFRMELYINGGWRGCVTSYNIPTDTWTHATGTYNGTHMSIYINGDLKQRCQQTGTINTPTTALEIGGRTDGSYWFDGRIDEVAIYSYAMPAREVRARYRTGLFERSFFTTSELLVHYQNQDTGLQPRNPVIKTFVNGNRTTRYGFGSTSASATGSGMPYGSVEVFVKTLLGIDYRVTVRLLSGADFLEIRIDEA
ncbi:MAG: LamG domain-containing protein [Candidatus Nanohaloarchaea archaeon]|nr:LamG domain-containing protein [Candidatus Nanohaloarchaea archaeon]